jgi:hypothetical protein
MARRSARSSAILGGSVSPIFAASNCLSAALNRCAKPLCRISVSNISSAATYAFLPASRKFASACLLAPIHRRRSSRLRRLPRTRQLTSPVTREPPTVAPAPISTPVVVSDNPTLPPLWPSRDVRPVLPYTSGERYFSPTIRSAVCFAITRSRRQHGARRRSKRPHRPELARLTAMRGLSVLAADLRSGAQFVRGFWAATGPAAHRDESSLESGFLWVPDRSVGADGCDDSSWRECSRWG